MSASVRARTLRAADMDSLEAHSLIRARSTAVWKVPADAGNFPGNDDLDHRNISAILFRAHLYPNASAAGIIPLRVQDQLQDPARLMGPLWTFTEDRPGGFVRAVTRCAELLE